MSFRFLDLDKVADHSSSFMVLMNFLAMMTLMSLMTFMTLTTKRASLHAKTFV